MAEDENRSEPNARPENEAARPAGNGEASGTVVELEARISDLTDRLLRAHAEMDNLRKRTERDKEDTAKYAISKFARDLLSIGDNLQRATSAVPAGAADADPALKALMEGVSMTEREFLNVLERNGVRRIDPEGEPFNPHQHQAMAEIEQPDVASGTIVQVYQPGYLIEDRVLRPAMVVVSKGGQRKQDAQPGNGSPAAG
ncbi:Heat shock protein GrpE [Hyphomicrobium sulfonivorans]|uniref:Protein GrpE n=1 Tax=Hyphomicrobium sulfonivorans TaxID=121290 RepID=A0A109BCU0_HYPSL|nr:nucleotide exchange factor GrpE [Hyphomicrobium sulfonivorans]KWT66249.1 Heat shock protein GrpE [Hyphomicrobium sulfonivorans]